MNVNNHKNTQNNFKFWICQALLRNRMKGEVVEVIPILSFQKEDSCVLLLVILDVWQYLSANGKYNGFEIVIDT